MARLRKNQNSIVLVLLGILLLGVFLAVYLAQQQQENRGQALRSTTLSFRHASFPDPIIDATVGEEVELDIRLDPGSNAVSFARIFITYDAFRLAPADTNAFTRNSSAFPITQEGPFFNNGTIAVALTIGNDLTKAIQTPITIGTVRFKTLVQTSIPTTVSFGGSTLILSVAATDQNNENVLSSTTPANILIANAATPTPTRTPTPLPTNTPTPTRTPTPQPTNTPTPTRTPTPLPTSTPTPTRTPTPQPTNTPTPTRTPTPTPVQNTSLSFSILLHGIGAAGDSVNPFGPGNQNPLTTTRSLRVEVYNSSNTLVLSRNDNIVFNQTSGKFTGTSNLGSTLASGNYTIRVKTDKYLRRLIPGFINLAPGQTFTVPQVEMIVGDIVNDNILNILDYNALIDCYSDLSGARACDATKKFQADLNDDGNVNQFDYNLFLRELTAQAGE